MTKEEQVGLFNFCMNWSMPLSDEFITAYCELKTVNNFYQFCYKHKLHRARFRKKNKK